ncbi:hypothetical protein H4S14_002789 [Agrobacterium vitis]|nr:hypothetical protein [Agrobacterium vitis]MBE1439029.1 hypothetical protein [Agrobacterium vitis]
MHIACTAIRHVMSFARMVIPCFSLYLVAAALTIFKMV